MLQTDPILQLSRREFALNGCAYMCLLHICEQYRRVSLSYKEILQETEYFIKSNWLKKDLYVNNWGKIARHLGMNAHYLGHTKLPEGDIHITHGLKNHFEHFWLTDYDPTGKYPYTDYEILDYRSFMLQE